MAALIWEFKTRHGQHKTAGISSQIVADLTAAPEQRNDIRLAAKPDMELSTSQQLVHGTVYDGTILMNKVYFILKSLIKRFNK